MDRLEAMTILVTVVEAGSFTAAGRRLGIPLPTVSRKLAELEAYLGGTRLLTRSTRRLSLTEAGADYVEACKRILEEIDDADRRASGEYVVPKGELVLAAPIVFGRLHIVPVVSEFLATYDEIDVKLLLSDRNAQLMDDHIDLALRIGALPDSAMIALRLGTVRWIVCASPAYLARNGRPETPADLARLPCVTFGIAGAVTPWMFALEGGVRSVPVRSRLSVNTAEAALDAAAQGVGLTRVLSYQAARSIEDGRLEPVLENFEPEALPVSLIHLPQQVLPLKTRSFIDFTVPRLRARLKSP
ncbi:LysR family transcriptional regulator [Jiella pelagia]|uniref:LysR family transcriptional regulator n=1 Tax=Jiella pelagia TaxID=2986949 RepID=A0ABY7BV44_9HYPH|nr:LysR family transcriptional regulator [Jiella pelagia]WAP67488.1 LysR family transcriptional regulator [Jiella pelagia]